MRRALAAGFSRRCSNSVCERRGIPRRHAGNRRSAAKFPIRQARCRPSPQSGPAGARIPSRSPLRLPPFSLPSDPAGHDLPQQEKGDAQADPFPGHVEAARRLPPVRKTTAVEIRCPATMSQRAASKAVRRTSNCRCGTGSRPRRRPRQTRAATIHSVSPSGADSVGTSQRTTTSARTSTAATACRRDRPARRRPEGGLRLAGRNACPVPGSAAVFRLALLMPCRRPAVLRRSMVPVPVLSPARPFPGSR